MQTPELLSVVRALVEQPTAPFHKEAVRDAIVAQLRVAVVLEPAKSDPVKALRDSLEKRAAGYSPLVRQI